MHTYLKPIRHFSLILVQAALIIACNISFGQALESPDQMLSKAMGTALLKAQNQMTGEGVCWHAAYKGERFIDGYLETKDQAYLRAGEQWYDALIAQMYTSPDGYKGFVGQAIYSKDKIADCHVGDAILCRIFLAHAELVLADTELKLTFGEKAQAYVDLVEKHLIEKWTERGTWWQNGPFGGYFTFNKYLVPEKMDAFQESLGEKSSIGYQFNKQLDMAVCHLRLYRITGNLMHRDKAERIYKHSKVRLNLYDDHYTWNYWEPFYPEDVLADNKLALWVATHPYRNYQAGEVHNFIEAFHSGLTFDETDIKRLIQTNMHMWNGDKENPKFNNSDDAAVIAATGVEKEFIPSKAYPTKAGALWSALCEFSPELAALGKKSATNTEFKRKYDLPVTVFEVPFSSSANINVAFAMPAAAKSGDTIRLVSKFRKAAPIKISLCANDGIELRTIFEGEHSGGNDGQDGILVNDWAVDLSAGTYRIRWQSGAEYRDYQIYIQ